MCVRVCVAQKTLAGNSLKNAESPLGVFFTLPAWNLEFPNVTWFVLDSPLFSTKIDRSILRKDRVNGRLISDFSFSE